PAALRNLGHDCRLVLPAFPEALRHTQQIETISQLRLFGYNEPVNLLYGHCGEHQTPVYLVDAPHFFNREGNPYLAPTGDTWADNADRFALFCRAAV
ncbi:glycogen synthase, partial [Candidatus Endoriftia persephone str. Guaymas]|nr:glycogen synthase [Candidatus Endoriftia persephone str. Guaymas]